MRVLLIEDDISTSRSIELMFNSEGFKVSITNLDREGIDLGEIEGRVFR